MSQQINLTKDVIIKFTPQQLPIVMHYLGKGVFEQVASIITAIESQIIEQLKTE